MAKLVRDEFMRRYPGVHIDLMGVNPGEAPSGSGGGFKRFCFGETDISNSSRFMKDDEIRKCAANNISFLEIPVAYDGLSVVVNRDNTWLNHLTVPELKAIWSQDSRIQSWHDLRPEFPNRAIRLFSPGRDNGTYDFFTEMIFGKPDVAPRQDVIVSTTPETLVRGIVSTPEAMGYFGLAYYIEHQEALKIVAIDGGKGPVLPTTETVLDGTYTPFSRPLFVYVNTRSLVRPEVRAFIGYFLAESSRVAQAVGYIPLPSDLHRLSVDRLSKNVEGSMRSLGQQPGTLRAMMVKP
jgi:phosphate transport system substrate-binding protein